MRKIVSRNPFSGKLNAEFDFLSTSELDTKIEKAEIGYEIHRKRTIKQRGQMIASLGSTITKNRNRLSQLITIEMGKPISQSQMEVDKTISFCRHYSTHFNDIIPTQIKTDARVKTLIKYLPMGIVYHIVPFNFPFFLGFKGGLGNLLLGNVCLTKNSDCNVLLGKLTEEIFVEAGYDSGEYQNVLSHHDDLEHILSKKSVAGVSFTGSSKSGAIIGQAAGKYIKRSVLQLGGNDPFVVLYDADLKKALQDAYIGRSRNCGQICFSPKRFIIVKEHYQIFKNKLIEKLENIKFGDPMDPNMEIGPLAREDLYTNLQNQLSRLPKSWKISWQKQEMKKPFFPVTVIEGSQEVFDEQLFGPVFTFFKAEDTEHAIRLANTGSYGLGSSVYGKVKAEQALDQIRAGMGFLNTITKSDYSFPTGGVGISGYGRQCGTEGIRSFANVKVHYID